VITLSDRDDAVDSFSGAHHRLVAVRAIVGPLLGDAVQPSKHCRGNPAALEMATGGTQPSRLAQLLGSRRY